MKEQFPVVVGIRPVGGDLDFLWEVFNLNKVLLSWVIKVSEVVVILRGYPILSDAIVPSRIKVLRWRRIGILIQIEPTKAGLPFCVQHPRQRVSVQFRDQFADER